MDKKYWEKYYKTKGVTEKPSPFAIFVLENYIKKNSSLIELGCGNGRDSIFFAKNKILVKAVDQCVEEILILDKKNTLSNLKFISADFTKLGATESFDNIYSRFTLHSISEPEESRVFKWAYQQLNSNGIFCIETRGKNNELYKLGNPVSGEPDAYIYEDHYRRFVDIQKLKGKLIQLGFNIIFAEEKSGFAPFNETDFKFIRVIAQKS